MFSTLEDDQLTAAVGRLRSVELAPGESVAEGSGRLLIVRRGRPRVVLPGAGTEVAVAELEPGDAFGVSALLGHDSGAKLAAVEPVTLLVLDDDAVAALAAKVPAFASALEGRRSDGARPAGGRRLSRITSRAGDDGPDRRRAGATADRLMDRRRRAADHRLVHRRVPMSVPAAADPVLHALAQAAVSATGASDGWLLAVEDAGLRVVAVAGPGTGAPVLAAVVPAGTGSAGFVAASGQPLAMAPRGDDPRFSEGTAQLLGRRPSSVLSVPASNDEGVVGVLELVDKAGGGNFSFDDVEIATMLADIAGVALTAERSSGPPSPALRSWAESWSDCRRPTRPGIRPWLQRWRPSSLVVEDAERPRPAFTRESQVLRLPGAVSLEDLVGRMGVGRRDRRGCAGGGDRQRDRSGPPCAGRLRRRGGRCRHRGGAGRRHHRPLRPARRRVRPRHRGRRDHPLARAGGHDHDIKVLGRGPRGQGGRLPARPGLGGGAGLRRDQPVARHQPPEWALPFYEVCDQAYFRNCFVVTAANNVPRPSFPSLFGSVTSVACNLATDPIRFHWNPEPPTEFLAPGIDIDVPWMGGGRMRDHGQLLRRPAHRRHRRPDPLEAPGACGPSR